MHTHHHVRFGGLRELRQYHFTRKEPYFPADYPGTKAGNTWMEEEAAIKKTEWEKRPPAKRTNYAKTDETGDWWKCDWDVLLSTPPAPLQLTGTRGPIMTESTIASDLDSRNKKWFYLPTPSLFPTTPIISSFTTPSSAPSVDTNYALVTVVITLLGRGSPSECARIWMAPQGCNIKDAPPSQDELKLVGFLTTGNYSLREGRAVGIGAVSWGMVRGKRKGLCVIKDVGVSVPRWARWEVMDG